MDMDLRGRRIQKDSQAYRLLDSDYVGTPGFLTIEPKASFRLDFWADRVVKLLGKVGDFIGVGKESAIQGDTSLAYKHKGGMVRVNVGLGRVEIEPHHPYLHEVCLELASLASKGK